MNVPLTRNATAQAEPAGPAVEPGAPNWDWRTVPAHRRTILDYFQVLGGASGRVALQTVYFLILANTLT